METENWYKNNSHDAGACGLIFNKKDGNYCPRHGCENHRDVCGGYHECVNCRINGIYTERYYDEEKALEAICWDEPINLIKKKNKIKKKLWITINPPDNGWTEQSFIDKIQKMMYGRNAINSCFWVFEWQNPGRKNKGIHCHIYIHEGDHRRIKHWVKRNFKKEYKLCKFCIDFKNPKAEWLEDKLDYVGGITFDENKDEKKEKDIERRKLFKLENIYFMNFDTYKDESDTIRPNTVNVSQVCQL